MPITPTKLRSSAPATKARTERLPDTPQVPAEETALRRLWADLHYGPRFPGRDLEARTLHVVPLETSDGLAGWAITLSGRPSRGMLLVTSLDDRREADPHRVDALRVVWVADDGRTRIFEPFRFGADFDVVAVVAEFIAVRTERPAAGGG